MIFSEADKAVGAGPTAEQPGEGAPPAPVHSPAAVAAAAAAPAEAVPSAAEQALTPTPQAPEETESESPAKPGEAAEAAAKVDYKSQLIDSLGLDANATDEQISQAIETSKTAAATAAAEKQTAKEKEVDALLDGYEITGDAKLILRDTLLNDRTKGEAILGAMQKKAAPAPAAPATPPPAPTHTPPGAPKAELSAQQKCDECNALIKEIQSTTKFSDYTQAREEARRRKPELFS